MLRAFKPVQRLPDIRHGQGANIGTKGVAKIHQGDVAFNLAQAKGLAGGFPMGAMWARGVTPAEGMEYWLIGTGPRDEPGIDGGLVRRPVPGPADSPALGAYPCTVSVESLDETLATADELGAEVALPRMPVTGVGWLACIKDPDGNVLGLLQSDPSAA